MLRFKRLNQQHTQNSENPQKLNLCTKHFPLSEFKYNCWTFTLKYYVTWYLFCPFLIATQHGPQTNRN